jgi:hypothetical protein
VSITAGRYRRDEDTLADSGLLAVSKIQVHLSKCLVRIAKRKRRKALHRAPMRPERADLAASIIILDNAADIFILFDPIDRPTVCQDVIRNEYNRGHKLRP